MRQPFGKFPFAGFYCVVFVIYVRQLYVGIAIARRDLSAEYPSYLKSVLLRVITNDADHVLLINVDSNRHVIEHAVVIFYSLWALGKIVVVQGESLTRHVNIHLKRNVAFTQPVHEEVLVGYVAVPKISAVFVIRNAYGGIRIIVVKACDRMLVSLLYLV